MLQQLQRDNGQGWCGVQVLLCPEKSRPQENKDKVLLGYTAMVDAWAMGILAYELIVGRPPFEKQSRAATYEHIMYRKPEFPPNMSPDAKDFVFTALTKVLYDRSVIFEWLYSIRGMFMFHLGGRAGGGRGVTACTGIKHWL